MKRVSAARRYDVPVEDGFAFITNTENWSKFWPGYVRLSTGHAGARAVTKRGSSYGSSAARVSSS